MKLNHHPKNEYAVGQADANIALAKYWGKRDPALNLPMNSSLSIGLKNLGTKTELTVAQNDEFLLNGEHDALAQKRLFDWIDKILPKRPKLHIQSVNHIPTAAGLASSSSAFAAATFALNNLFDWQLEPSSLSAIARRGSGSACRSIEKGFVIWHKGQLSDGSDSVAQSLDVDWSDFSIGIEMVDNQPKTISSTTGMNQTVQTSPLYSSWVEYADDCVHKIKRAIEQKAFAELGAVVEQNAMTMHATMMSAQPMIHYWQPNTYAAIEKVLLLRRNGCAVFYTMDAGPNLKLLFLKPDLDQIMAVFPNLITVFPFND